MGGSRLETRTAGCRTLKYMLIYFKSVNLSKYRTCVQFPKVQYEKQGFLLQDLILTDLMPPHLLGFAMYLQG